MILDQKLMELQFLYKYGTGILTKQRRGPLLSAANRTSYLEQKKNTQASTRSSSFTTSRPNIKVCGGGSVNADCVSALM
jgi:hypothetical protein